MQERKTVEAKPVLSRALRAISPLLSIVAACFLLPSLGMAQVTTADIVGTVTDPSGAAVVTGTATATSAGTNVTQKVALTNSGAFQFTLLQVGTYKVTVQAAGFKSFVTTVTLSVGDRARINAQLSLGQAEQTVTVEGTSPALQTDESTIGTLITSQETQNLPLNGRNVLNLITMSAGVTGGLGNAMNSGTRPDDRRQGSNFAANGQSDEVNNNMVDGMDNNERFIGSVGVKPAIDAVEEVKVFTNLYTAEVSRSGGGIVDLITKSGTNQFHGTLYEFLRNDKFDAKDYFASVGPKPELRQNQFGGSVGGPIWKNKTFFFFDYESLRLVKGVTNTSTVPTSYEEMNPGDFSDLGEGCTNLTTIDGWTPGVIGLNYFKMYPAPNQNVAPSGTNCTPPSNNYIFTGGQTQFTKTYDARADHRISTKDSMWGRYTYNNANVYIPGNYPVVTLGGTKINPGAGPYGNFSGPAIDDDQSVALGYTHVFSSSWVADIRAQYLRLDHDSTPVNVGVDAANAIGFPCDATACVNGPGDIYQSGLPNLNFSHGYGALGDADYVPLKNQQNSFEYLGSISWLKRTHSIKFGASAIRRQGSLGQSAHPRGQLNITGLVTGNDLGDMLEDYASSIARSETLTPPSFRTSEFAGYFQDDWRVRPNITLNLGLRWDLFTPFTAQNGAHDNWSLPLGVIIGPNLIGVQHSSPTGGVNRDFTDYAPRIGMAYSVRPGLVVRAGYGIGYFPSNDANGAVNPNAPAEFSYGCGNTSYTTSGPCVGQFTNAAIDANGGYYMDGSMPIPVVNVLNATDPALYAGTTIFGTVPDYKNPYLQQFSLNVEKDFFHGNVVTLAYVGNRGDRLVLNSTNQNQLPYPVADGGTFPFASLVPATCSQYADCSAIGAGVLNSVGVQMRETVMKSNYNAMQISLQRRIKSGLLANVNYTWAHNLTNAQVIDEGQTVGNCVGPCHVDDGTGKAVNYNSYFQYDYGNADLDTRSRLALFMGYDLPFGNGLNGPVGIIAKGWSVNAAYYAQTGNPFTVQNASAQSDIGLGNDRPNHIKPSGGGFHKGVGEWFDVTQFQRQGAGLLGNEIRNPIYGPGTQALIFSLFKTFPLYESWKLQFRAESFNLFNTPTFNTPNATINSYDANGVAVPNVGVGEISSTTAAASPRQLQFALKILF